MTSHLDEGTLNALLDGEIPSSEIPALQEHLAGCDACRTRLEESRALRDEAFALLEALDSAPEPAAAATPVVPLRRPRPGSGRRTWVTGLAWAASLALAVSAGYFVAESRGPAPDLGEVLAAAPTELESPAVRDERESSPAADTAGPPVPGPAQNRTPNPPAAAAAPAGAVDRLALAAEPAPADGRARRDAPAEDRPPARLQEAAEPTRESRAARLEQAASGAEAEAGKRAAKVADANADADSLAVVRPRAAQALSVVGAARNVARPATAVEAVQILGGSLRLVEGLVPERITVVGDTVRVEYATAFGPLLLEQWRDGELRSRLVAPAAAPADSIAAWRRRIPGGASR